MIKVKYRIPKVIYQQMLTDLRRPHEHAYERIGFLFTKSKLISKNTYLITSYSYHPVADGNYIEDETVGARINSNAIRSAMQQALTDECGVFHVHLHNQKGKPGMSWTDEEGIPPMIESLANVAPMQCHGIMILSNDSIYIDIKAPDNNNYIQPELISIVGYPAKYFLLKKNTLFQRGIYERQSFLGTNSEFLLDNITIGIIGYGGGGSHIGLQLAHLGVSNLVVFDDDRIESSNLNRLVGGWQQDVDKCLEKTEIAKRTIKNVLPDANVVTVQSRWQENPEILQSCDVIVGCVDSFLERQQLEAECRRYLIPLIDIGMDVHTFGNKFSMSGQVILSMPGGACMHCLGFLTDEKLSREAAKYGNIGGRPQVVWPNGVLASTAVGIIIDIITGWTLQNDKSIYLVYNGNTGALTDHIRLDYTPKNCEHYRLTETGQPKFVAL